jgi:hypothetical protein
MASTTRKTSTTPADADAVELETVSPVQVARDAIAEVSRALNGHTGSNPFGLAYRLPGARLTLAEVAEILNTGARLYTGPTPVEFASLDKASKPSDDERASWYHVPPRAGSSERIARGAALLGLPAGHILTTWAPGAADITALMREADPIAAAESIATAAEKRAEERAAEERKKAVNSVVTVARNMVKGNAPTAVVRTAVEATATGAGLSMEDVTAALSAAGIDLS